MLSSGLVFSSSLVGSAFRGVARLPPVVGLESYRLRLRAVVWHLFRISVGYALRIIGEF